VGHPLAVRLAQGLLLSLPPLGVAVPTFWVGLMLLQVFSFDFHVFPGTGNEGIMSLILSAVTMAIPAGVLISSPLARSLDDALTAPYADTARSKGASETRAQFRHALRNAVTSTVTVLGLLVGQPDGGAHPPCGPVAELAGGAGGMPGRAGRA
jgi:peptide/nickel transport system permease protein